jgi:very-short-patch-repair endonuclease
MKQKLTQLARNLRKDQTPEEVKLWYFLRRKRFQKYKLRRQFPIEKYIVDFICLAKRLIIELDGGQHNQSKHDIVRDKYLTDQDFRILRFWNNDVNQNLESVLDKIYLTLQQITLIPRIESGAGSTPSPVKGEGRLHLIQCEIHVLLKFTATHQNNNLLITSPLNPRDLRRFASFCFSFVASSLNVEY